MDTNRFCQFAFDASYNGGQPAGIMANEDHTEFELFRLSQTVDKTWNERGLIKFLGVIAYVDGVAVCELSSELPKTTVAALTKEFVKLTPTAPVSREIEALRCLWDIPADRMDA